MPERTTVADFETTRRLIGLGILTLLGLSMQLPVASAAPSEPAVFSTKKGAIRGYDPVAYFTEAREVKGEPEYSHSWNDAEWYFSSQENLDLFRNDPEAYSPQYGGYCAYAMSKGYYASIDPKAWSVFDGKLYLNYSKSVRKTWSKDIPGHIERADRNWRKFRSGE